MDTLILGCTHYPILQKTFERKMGKNCVIIDSGKAQAEKFQKYLENHSEISEKFSRNAEKKIQFLTTDCPKKFLNLGQKFLGMKILSVEKIEI